MIHEAWGIDDVLRRQADRLAAAGYLVFAPDLIGEGSWLRCIVATFRAFQARSGRPFELIESCRQQLIADPACTGRSASSASAWAADSPCCWLPDGFQASAVNYGVGARGHRRDRCAGLPDRRQLRRQGPDGVKSVPALQAALAAHGCRTTSRSTRAPATLPQRRTERTAAVFRPLAKLSHAGPEPVAAADAWRRIEAFFAEHLGSAPPSS